MRIINTRSRTPRQIAEELALPALEAAAEQEAAVREIIEAVRARGDEAVIEYTRRFDWPDAAPDRLAATQQETAAARAEVGDDFLAAVRHAAANVRSFHQKQLPSDWMDLAHTGALLGQKFTPIERVGIHVPGFTAVYPSSLIMTVVPAQVAGVPEITLLTPAGKDGAIPAATLAAASELGVAPVLKVGGAQAVAALAYGTQTIPKVDKVFGPGSVWVMLAKKMVYGAVGIDGLYGPSEVAIIADETADPRLIAADLLAQAEHMTDSPAYLLTPANDLVDPVQSEIEAQLPQLSRREIAREALQRFGAAVVTKDLDEACAVVNEIAPEHVQICTAEPFAQLAKVRNAGCIFLGSSSPVPMGDYVIGPSHVLPTGRTARFSSGLGTMDFMKRSSIVYTSQQALRGNLDALRALADLEGFDAHLRAVQARLRRS